MDFDRSLFKEEFMASGMWIPIRVTSTSSPPVITDTHAGYKQPMDYKNGGVNISNQHEIKYQADDLPDLAKDHRVDFLDEDGDPIAGKNFRVRQPPFVTEDPNDDQTGYFMLALLTKL